MVLTLSFEGIKSGVEKEKKVSRSYLPRPCVQYLLALVYTRMDPFYFPFHILPCWKVAHSLRSSLTGCELSPFRLDITLCMVM